MYRIAIAVILAASSAASFAGEPTIEDMFHQLCQGAGGKASKNSTDYSDEWTCDRGDEVIFRGHRYNYEPEIINMDLSAKDADFVNKSPEKNWLPLEDVFFNDRVIGAACNATYGQGEAQVEQTSTRVPIAGDVPVFICRKHDVDEGFVVMGFHTHSYRILKY